MNLKSMLKNSLKIPLLFLAVFLIALGCSTHAEKQDLKSSPCENSTTEEQIYQKETYKTNNQNANVFVQCNNDSKPVAKLALNN